MGALPVMLGGVLLFQTGFGPAGACRLTCCGRSAALYPASSRPVRDVGRQGAEGSISWPVHKCCK